MGRGMEWTWPWTVAETATGIGALLGTASFIERRLEKWLAKREARQKVLPDVEVSPVERNPGDARCALHITVRNRWRNSLRLESLAVVEPRGAVLTGPRSVGEEEASGTAEIALGHAVRPAGAEPSEDRRSPLRHYGDRAYLLPKLHLPDAMAQRGTVPVQLALKVVLKGATDRRAEIRLRFTV
jgi:hypothetical protein